MIKKIKAKTKNILQDPLGEAEIVDALKDSTSLYDAMADSFNLKRNFIQLIKNDRGNAYTFINIGDYYQSTLGQWIYDEGKRLCSDSKEWQHLKKTHRKAHLTAHDVLYFYNEGKIKHAQHVFLKSYIPLSNEVQKSATRLHKEMLDKNTK